MLRLISVTATVLAVNVAAFGQVIDGTKVGDAYGPARAVQTVQTQFGDNESEWNAAYGTISGGRLNLMLTGNLQNNFNKLEILIDSKAGGFNVFPAQPGNDGAFRMAGTTFDTGFDPDYHIIARRGDSKFDVDFAELGTANFNFYSDVFGGADFGSGQTGTGVNASPIDVAYDGSNTAGVIGGDQAADQGAALAVETGLELSIDLADLGSLGGPIKVMVFQNNQDHNFASNQFLGGLPAPQGNLGGDGAGGFTGSMVIDFNNFGGEQYFIVPEPASLSLLALAALGLIRRR